ncbi:unnamed protein product, partial [Polarella glacialis]
MTSGVGAAVARFPSETASLRLNSMRFCLWAQHLQKRRSVLCCKPTVSGGEITPRLATVVLGGLARKRLPEVSVQVLIVMQASRVEVNVYHFSAAISACEKGGQWQQALNLLSLMPEASVAPNEITYNATMSACEKGGQWQLALSLLSLMPEARVVPDKITYSAAIS